MAERKYSPRTVKPTPTMVRSTWKYVRSNLLTVLTIIGIVLGITFGCILKNSKEDKWSQREQVYVKFGGEIFLRMLKALTLPLILSSVIAALGSLDLRQAGKVGLRTFLFYLLTTVCAVFLGIILVVTIHPGVPSKDDQLKHPVQIQPRKILNSDVMMDMIRNMFPSNLFQATMSQYQTIMDFPSMAEMEQKLKANETTDDSDIPTKGTNVDGTNMLGLLAFSVLFGIGLSTLGPFGRPILKLVRVFSQLMMVIANWVLWLAPAGIFCLVAGQMLGAHDVSEVFEKTKMYIFTVLLGFAIHGFLVLPVLYYIISGSHPLRVLANVIHALVTAFGTSSSIAALPATVSCLEERGGVDPRISRFVLPVGAAINMDGTALYEAVAAVFLAQMHGVSLDLGSIVAISFIVTIGSMGASGIPHAGITILTMLMNLLGVPVTSIALLIPIDFFLHRFRTTLNVLGDAFGASLVDRLCKEGLAELPFDRSLIRSKELTTSAEEV